MTTTAEGIETMDQLDAVHRAGCTEAQGYLLGRPQPLEMAEFAERFSSALGAGGYPLDRDFSWAGDV
jgi:EAL domain-containing protein (putative c-di-GMP-specific phosphodiesterase class I)